MIKKKADILEVGYIDENNMPQEWNFDCKFSVPGIELTDGTSFYGGYTIDELRDISIKNTDREK